MSYIQHKAEESLEDYLETILILSKRLSAVRSIDVATELHISVPYHKFLLHFQNLSPWWW